MKNETPDAEAIDIASLDVGRPKIDRLDGWSEIRRRRFLAVLIETGNVSEAARAADKSTTSVYQLRIRDATFRQAWAIAAQAAQGRVAVVMQKHITQGMVRTTKTSSGFERTEHYFPERLTIAAYDRLERQAAWAPPGDDGGRNEDTLCAAVEARLKKLGLLT